MSLEAFSDKGKAPSVVDSAEVRGYAVHEVVVSVNDGGVNLVIVDKRGERTAVQAKCYADHNLVLLQTVREHMAANRNHSCILTLLVTTSDLTESAKKEAEQFRVEYWHGRVVSRKINSWKANKTRRTHGTRT
ncbi:restriction endonuclease [Cohnella soli]|uniref:Restriction endonuclease n=1 Tax=Cohnella soli TaxID=425005 RepID=A0ABW0HUP2_9BACL